MENFKKMLIALRPDILRFAKIQLRDDTLAEDMVQDTLATAIDKFQQFRGDAVLKTWIITILKNKITDYFRSRKNISSLEELQEENAAIDAQYNQCFDESDHWLSSASPNHWGETPEEFSHRQAFFRTLENCLQGLPEDTAQIFYLREIMGMEVEEICNNFNITKENCYVILHRARNGLRKCLQHRWFDLND
ncbi:sigma-70 family RNA polymerase sigma factor [Neisseria zalophi]|uniref:Sigma-70 family RNA polymerase sigma factor n=1 Tax=Neisseria zalophi TaxID=640030 RepID=A0A5J6PW33_9NEIS|nr:sigma-70 family RNA polymerase sigma factor [Neisseria zalophi]QEY26891.1 sigma-70 family RNA polymerase sigma factor [Neisseria zalophi]